MDQVEKDRALETKPPSLNLVAFEAAWTAFQNTSTDLIEDSDDETCRCVGNAIVAYLNALHSSSRNTEPKS